MMHQRYDMDQDATFNITNNTNVTKRVGHVKDKTSSSSSSSFKLKSSCCSPISNIMLACIILHNMIVEDKRDTFSGNVDVDNGHVDNDISNV